MFAGVMVYSLLMLVNIIMLIISKSVKESNRAMLFGSTRFVYVLWFAFEMLLLAAVGILSVLSVIYEWHGFALLFSYYPTSLLSLSLPATIISITFSLISAILYFFGPAIIWFGNKLPTYNQVVNNGSNPQIPLFARLWPLFFVICTISAFLSTILRTSAMLNFIVLIFYSIMLFFVKHSQRVAKLKPQLAPFAELVRYVYWFALLIFSTIFVGCIFMGIAEYGAPKQFINISSLPEMQPVWLPVTMSLYCLFTMVAHFAWFVYTYYVWWKRPKDKVNNKTQ
jgi:hypothetical protein